MKIKDVLAIDFGTTNTYFSKCRGDKRLPESIDFGNSRDGLSTSILYRHNKQIIVGDNAFDGFNDATAEERAGYNIRTHFKPDIAESQEARKNSIDFLKGLLEMAKSESIDIEPADKEVIFGVPSESDENYRKVLKEIAAQSGYGDIKTMDEPKGAILYHLNQKDFSVKDALNRVLVIDFGGGTCDFAILYKGKIEKSWGDMHLGGRLFDDLFFQWFLESNPDSLKKIRADNKEYFISAFRCREVKEHFSKTAARDRNETVVKSVDNYGRIYMDWEVFLNKAKCYKISDNLKKQLSDTGVNYSSFPGYKEPVDLIEEFRLCLLKGMSTEKANNIDLVILAGGSSLWSFVTEIVKDELSIEANQIKRADRPYAVISKGLSLYPALRRELGKTQKILNGELSDKLDEIDFQINEIIEITARQIAAEVKIKVFDEILFPILTKFRAEGGSMSELENKISLETNQFKSQLEIIVEKNLGLLSSHISERTNNLVSDWFEKNELIFPDEKFSGETKEENIGINISIDQLHSAIEKGFKLGALIVSIIVAIILSEPIGWIAGVLVALPVGILTIKYGWDGTKKIAKDKKIPSLILRKMIFTDKKINSLREKIGSRIKSDVLDELKKNKSSLLSLVKDKIKDQINSLTEIQKF